VSDINTLIDRLNDRQRREFALWCAERVRHLMSDPRSTAALDVAARHLRGEATDAELNAAWVEATAAMVAASDAAAVVLNATDAARSAVGAPSRKMVREVVREAARLSVWALAGAAAHTSRHLLGKATDAARAAAWDAAWSAARTAERAAQFAELNRMLKEVTP
jgi:hypothetical protein